MKSLAILLSSLVSLVEASGNQDEIPLAGKIGIAVGVLIILGFLIGLCCCYYCKDKDRCNEVTERICTSCLETALCYHDCPSCDDD